MVRQFLHQDDGRSLYRLPFGVTPPVAARDASKDQFHHRRPLDRLQLPGIRPPKCARGVSSLTDKVSVAHGGASHCGTTRKELFF